MTQPVKLLHVDASILGANSASRQVSAAVVERLRQAKPDVQVTYRDLAATPLVHLSGEHVAAAMGAQPESTAVQQELAESQAVLREFLDADTVVIGAPMYNFGVPSQLKAWIDRIAVKGKTFAYDANGPRGLAGGKRVIIAVSRGGFYGAGAPAAAFEHMETYLRAVFAFLGVTDLQIIVAEGLNVGPEQREKALQDALAAATSLAA
jgi:FMN-dependent NADH-azoreductase